MQGGSWQDALETIAVFGIPFAAHVLFPDWMTLTLLILPVIHFVQLALFVTLRAPSSGLLALTALIDLLAFLMQLGHYFKVIDYHLDSPSSQTYDIVKLCFVGAYVLCSLCRALQLCQTPPPPQQTTHHTPQYVVLQPGVGYPNKGKQVAYVYPNSVL